MFWLGKVNGTINFAGSLNKDEPVIMEKLLL